MLLARSGSMRTIRKVKEKTTSNARIVVHSLKQIISETDFIARFFCPAISQNTENILYFSLVDLVSSPFCANKKEIYEGISDPDTFFRPSLRSLLVSIFHYSRRWILTEQFKIANYNNLYVLITRFIISSLIWT